MLVPMYEVGAPGHADLLVPWPLARLLCVVEEVVFSLGEAERGLIEGRGFPGGLGLQHRVGQLPVFQVVAPCQANDRFALLVAGLRVRMPGRQESPVDLDQFPRIEQPALA